MTAPVTPSPRLPKPLLLQILQQISGVQCVWRSAQRPHLGQQPGTEHAWIVASAQSWRAVGVDELRQVYNATTNALDNMTVGQRLFTLTLRAESLDANLDALDLLERVRFRLRSATARNLMVPTLALVDFQAIQTLPDQVATAGGVARALKVAHLDVRMACVVAADQGDPGEGGFIQSATLPNPVAGGNLT
jgi:hypothetical protein